MAVFTSHTSCGFAKLILHLTRLNQPYFKSNMLNEKLLVNPTTEQKLDRYTSFFLERKKQYEVDIRTFRNGMAKHKASILKLIKHKNSDKQYCFEAFAPEVFMNMNDRQRSKHSLENCEGCRTDFENAMEKFNSKSKKQLTVTINSTKSISTPKQSAMEIMQSLNNTFQKEYQKTSFTETLAKLPTSGVEIKQSKYGKKQKSRKQLRNITNIINNDLNSTSVERCLGTRWSLNTRKKERILRSFEDYNSAKTRDSMYCYLGEHRNTF